MLFHRLAVSKNKDQVLELASRGIDMHKPDNVIKDPYVLEYAQREIMSL
jgi:predicted nuclease of restriction endonuclease-like (RecB) superfamily